jgi:phospholipid/cholesterol/gamma-HCH transport system substrate-binding protein
MDAHPRYTLVGILVSLILAALAIWLTWLWRAGSKDQTVRYQINFRQHSLSGLQVDGIVTMRGMRVGTIKKIELDPDDIENVRVQIILNKQAAVRTDTEAVVIRNLLTGLASIDLVGTSQTSDLLVAQGNNLPSIKEGKGAVDRIFQDLPNLFGKAADSMEKIDTLLNPENLESFHNILQNLEKASARIDPLLASVEKTVVTLNSSSAETKQKLVPLLDSLKATSDQSRDSLHSMSIDFSLLSKNIGAAAESLKQPRSSILGLPSGQLGPGEGQ